MTVFQEVIPMPAQVEPLDDVGEPSPATTGRYANAMPDTDKLIALLERDIGAMRRDISEINQAVKERYQDHESRLRAIENTIMPASAVQDYETRMRKVEERTIELYTRLHIVAGLLTALSLLASAIAAWLGVR